MPIRESGLDQTRARLEGIAARLANLQPVMEVAAQDTVSLISDSFQRSSSPDGTPWAPLSAATVRINPRRQGGKPLVDTARLSNSITGVGSARGLKFGTNVSYAGPQNFGARIRTFGRGSLRGLPARPFLPVTGNGNGYSLMTGGAAGAHWTRARDMIAHYVRTGEIK